MNLGPYQENSIIVGDCLKVMAGMPGRCVDMVLCDLPYGTTQCKWDTIIPFEPLWEQYKRVTKNNAAIVLTASQSFTSRLVVSNLQWFRYEIIWEKERPTNIFFIKNQIGRVHENVLVFYKHQPTYNPQMMPRLSKYSQYEGKRDLTKYNTNRHLTHPDQPAYRYSKDYDPTVVYPRSVLKINRETGKKRHPTQKPVALFEYLIKTYSNEGDLIFDGCMGSGTTAIAADRLRRRWFGCDISEEYVAMANERIAKDREKRAQIEMKL